MTNTTKMTKKMRYEALLTLDAVKEIDGMVDFINHELELLARKASSDSKAKAKTSAENEMIASLILGAINANQLYRASEIQAAVPELMPPLYTLPKITAVLGQLCEQQKMERITEKGKSYYKMLAD